MKQNVMNLSITKDRLARYLRQFAPSLEQFSEAYVHQLFPNANPVPPHVLYLCPLCLKSYMLFRETDYEFNAEFSMDHFPPKNVGGKLMALVCKKCNNDAGAYFDFITKDWINETAFECRIPLAEIKATHVISSVKGYFKGKLAIDEKGEMIIHLKNDENAKIKPLEDWLNDENKSNDYTIQMTIPRSDKAKTAKAFLKTAYLACFHHWGYQFVLSDTAKQAREVIFGEAKYPIDNVPFLIFHEPEMVDRMPLGVCFIKNPVEWQTFLVNIPIKHKPSKTNWVVSMIIPPEGGWSQLSAFNNFFPEDGKVNVDIVPLQPSVTVNDFQGYTNDWIKLTGRG